MAERKWYLLCLGLALAAVAAEVFADHEAAAEAEVIAKATAEGGRDAMPLARHHARLSRLGSRMGLTLAALSLLSWAISVSRGERAMQSVPVVLLAMYGLLALLTV